jgi:hypothetical protein
MCLIKELSEKIKHINSKSLTEMLKHSTQDFKLQQIMT